MRCAAGVVLLVAACGGGARASHDAGTAGTMPDPLVACPDQAAAMHQMIDTHRSCATDADCSYVYSSCLDHPDACNGAYGVSRTLDRTAFSMLEAQLRACLQGQVDVSTAVCGRCLIGMVDDHPPCVDGRCGGQATTCPNVTCGLDDGRYCLAGGAVDAQQNPLPAGAVCVSVHDPERLGAGDRTPLAPEVPINECGQFRLPHLPTAVTTVVLAAHDCTGATPTYCWTGQLTMLQPVDQVGSYAILRPTPAASGCACSCTAPTRCAAPDLPICL